jgi:hypothetical protein
MLGSLTCWNVLSNPVQYQSSIRASVQGGLTCVKIRGSTSLPKVLSHRKCIEIKIDFLSRSSICDFSRLAWYQKRRNGPALALNFDFEVYTLAEHSHQKLACPCHECEKAAVFLRCQNSAPTSKSLRSISASSSWTSCRVMRSHLSQRNPLNKCQPGRPDREIRT